MLSDCRSKLHAWIIHRLFCFNEVNTCFTCKHNYHKFFFCISIDHEYTIAGCERSQLSIYIFIYMLTVHTYIIIVAIILNTKEKR